MRLLFELDKKDYGNCSEKLVRNSARSIIIRSGRIAMVHSLKFDYYKFPGGGIRKGEDPVTAMIRETLEEAGLEVIPSSIREYGCVHRIQRDAYNENRCFVQDNFYYLAEAEPHMRKQNLDDYEADERFTLEFVDPKKAIETNRNSDHGPKDQMMIEREARVLELLIKEGLFEKT